MHSLCETAAQLRRSTLTVSSLVKDVALGRRARLRRRYVVAATAVAVLHLAFIRTRAFGVPFCEIGFAPGRVYHDTLARDGAWGGPALGTATYLVATFYLARLMQGKREPISKRLFECMIVFYLYGLVFNAWVAGALVLEARKRGVGSYWPPWGLGPPQFSTGGRPSDLAALIYVAYKNKYVELFDTMFLLLRKKFGPASFLHVYQRVMFLWLAWLAARGGENDATWVLVAARAATTALLSGGHLLAIVRGRGPPQTRAPPTRTARFFGTTTVLALEHAFLAVHAGLAVAHRGVSCADTAAVAVRATVDDVARRWAGGGGGAFLEQTAAKLLNCVDLSAKAWVTLRGAGSEAALETSRPPLALLLALAQLFVSVNVLTILTDFEYVEDKKPVEDTADSEESARLVFSFDSSGWLYVYHFGVAKYIEEHIVPVAGHDALAFSGSSGGALVAASLACGVPSSKLFEFVLDCLPECRRNPVKMVRCVEKALDFLLPEDGHVRASHRLRILLTKVVAGPPFLMGEVASAFESREQLWQLLRASCHMPLVAGVLPYGVRGALYFDGLFWSSTLAFVQWRGFLASDHVVKVSSLSLLGCDILPRRAFVPPWWGLFPPGRDVLEGLMIQGYRDAADHFKAWDPAGAPHLAAAAYELRLRRTARPFFPDADGAPAGAADARRVDALRNSVVKAWLLFAATVLSLALLSAAAALVAYICFDAFVAQQQHGQGVSAPPPPPANGVAALWRRARRLHKAPGDL
ncbi:acyl transferase/acyl hydrolase/lysophospholipase [Pelagophyceae sp. CCMP2097]|nr:acyl transferase/acyl hydrolase/lysophospholipase [Pelagophyceae sp. CCMP2097]